MSSYDEMHLRVNLRKLAAHYRAMADAVQRRAPYLNEDDRSSCLHDVAIWRVVYTVLEAYLAEREDDRASVVTSETVTRCLSDSLAEMLAAANSDQADDAEE